MEPVTHETRKELRRRRDAGIATTAELLEHHERRRAAIQAGKPDPCAEP